MPNLALRAFTALVLVTVIPLANTAAPAFGQAPAFLPALSQAQPAATADGAARQSYDAAYFAQYAPSTALQMVQRLPGFSLDTGNQDVRGFSGAAGNVVIDGQRPSSKSDALDTVLARIPAGRVARIEVAPGDQFGSDYTGKPQVANVVLVAGDGLSGTVEASAYRVQTGNIYPEGSASVVLKRGQSSFTVAANVSAGDFPEEGFDRITSLVTGQQTEFRGKFNDIRAPNYAFSSAWDFNGGVNKTAHLNGRIAFDRFSLTQNNDVFPAVGPIRDDRLFQRYNRRDIEIGGDVTRPLAGGGIKLVGLVTRRHRENRDTSLNRISASVIGGSEQFLVDEREETLARLTWSRQGWSGWNVELGAEGALNRLVSNVDLSIFGAGGTRTVIDLPIDDATVKEIRGETFVNVGRQLARNLKVDGGLTFEASRLTVSGDATAERTLKFLKPKLSIDWRLSDLHAQLSLQRTVAQLQFEDFISVAELTNDRVNGGNAGLLPQRAWSALVTLDRPLLGDGLIKLELGYTSISLLQDRVPTPEGFDAPGNIGNGRELIWRGTIDAPLGKLGIKGGRLTLYGSIVDTSVRDPYTGQKRRFSGNSLAYWRINFRQDLGKMAWGLDVEASSSSTTYRQDELDTFRGIQPYASIFAEYRPDKTTSIRVGARNILDRPAARFRTFFSPSRANPVPFAFEERGRNPHVTPYITVKRSF